MGDVIVGIDIGTSKVCTLIGRVTGDNQIEILGKGMDTCTGVKKGIIVDIDSTSNSIKNSVEQAESAANFKITSAYVNITGNHVTIINNRNTAVISGENHEITARDVEKVLYDTENVSIPEDRQIIDIIPRQYIIDGYDEIIDPVGMVGVKLEAEADLIAARTTSVQNILKSLQRAGVKAEGIVIEALAASEIVLTPDEKEMGAVLIDVGGGITDISVFKNKRLLYYDSIPVGGDHITNDIAIGLKIPYSEAEKIKRQYELALTSLIKNDQDIVVNEISENRKKSVKISEVVEIIEARVYEIFSLCREILMKSEMQGNYGAGVILTGGGISYVDGNIQLAHEVFDIPVRVAVPRLSGITKPELITAAGIVKYVAVHRRSGSTGSDAKIRKKRKSQDDMKLLTRLARFFKRLF